MKMKQIICCLAVLLACGTASAKVLTLTPAKEEKEKNLRCEVKEAEHGLQAVLRFTAPVNTNKKDEPTGGNWQVVLDGQALGGAPFQGASLEKTLDLPNVFLSNGQHTLRCVIHNSSGEHAVERSFAFDATPGLSLSKPVIDNGLLDAAVSLRFFGGNEELLGFVDVLLDAQPLTQVRVRKQPGPTSLSRLLGKPVAVGQLPAGVHLLTLRAAGFNGAATVERLAFTIQSLPELVVKTDKQNHLLEAQARFLPVAAGYFGNVEVWVDQDLLLTRHAEQETVIMTRDELIEALKKRGRVDLSRPVALVFALKAMNAAERWQVVELAP